MLKEEIQAYKEPLMDKLRTGIEGYELPQNSNILIDDINLVITNYASNYFYYYWFNSHHIT